LCKDISHLELLLTSSVIIDDKRDVHQNSSVYNNSKKATYNPHLLMHFVIAIMLRCFVVVDVVVVDNARYLTSELEKINVEER
jgi:hypothetical protein